MIPPRTNITAASVIRVFESAEEYTRYVGANRQWTSGLWVPDKKELVIRPAEAQSTTEQRDRVLHTIYHEAFHQYLFYALDMTDASPWFNEGHAALFEDVEVRNGRATLKEDETKVQILRRLIGSADADVKRMLQLSYEDFYAGDDQTRTAHYVVAWSIVYYLRRAPVADKPAAYRRILDVYMDALWRTRDPVKATDEAFQGIDRSAFQRDLVAFWQSDRKRAAALRNKFP